MVPSASPSGTITSSSCVAYEKENYAGSYQVIPRGIKTTFNFAPKSLKLPDGVTGVAIATTPIGDTFWDIPGSMTSCVNSGVAPDVPLEVLNPAPVLTAITFKL